MVPHSDEMSDEKCQIDFPTSDKDAITPEHFSLDICHFSFLIVDSGTPQRQKNVK